MAVYRPISPPGVTDPTLKAIVEWVENELVQITRVSEAEGGGLSMRVLHVEPTRPRTGMVVYADGSDWDPGSGEGLYAYSSAGVWVAL